jgi:PAS domain S-box-containing protein
VNNRDAKTVLVSEIRYRRLFEAARDGILIVDAETGGIVDVNPFLIELLGLSREHFLGKKVWEIGTFKDVFASKEKFLELQKVGYVRYDDLPLEAVDGRKVQVEFVSNVYREDRGDVIQCNIRDNTVRNHAEEALRVSMEEFRTLAEAMPQIVWITGPDGKTIFFNRKWMDYTGMTREESMGDGWNKPFHPDDRQTAWDAWQKATRERGVYSLESRLRRADGVYRWWLVRGVPMVDADDKISKWYGTCTDIHDLKMATAELATSEKRFRTTFEQAAIGIANVSIKGKWLEVNQQLCKMLGYAGEELLTKSFQDLTLPEDVAIDVQNRDKLLSGELQAYSREKQYIRKDGSQVWANITVTLLRNEAGVPLHFISIIEDMTERKQAEAELERVRAAIEQSGEAIIITDPKGSILYVNPAFEAATGYSRQEIEGANPRILNSGKQDEAVYRELWETVSSGRTWKGRLVNKRKDGTLFTEDATISPVRDAAGQIISYVAVKRDVTAYIRLEEELRQSQKMESVGRLAGGVAHDFNNILTAINGYAGFAMAGLPEGDQRRADLLDVLAAGARAVRLTRQLLAFSRKQILNPQVLDINAGVGATVNMLRRLIGEDITLETQLAPYPCLVKVDNGQIEQVFLNLAVNARDAMPKGGTLTFATGIVTPAEDFASRHPDMPRGSLLCLSVSDTGYGMTDEVKTHLFEPFFTTKEQGKGTGLGLATVFGIIKQSGGAVEVESAPDHGTIFRIYLPQIDEKAQDKDKDVVPQGNETVLLVEDDESIRRLAARALTINGYFVLTAADGQEALRVLERHGKPVDLLITDVVMPGMSGRELAQTIAKKNLAHRAPSRLLWKIEKRNLWLKKPYNHAS